MLLHVNSQLVCLQPAEILNLVTFILDIYLSLFVHIGPEKPQWEWSITYTLHYKCTLIAGFVQQIRLILVSAFA